MCKTPDVVICGAGAAGLTLAIELARRGVSLRLIEQRATSFHGSRGKGIQPRSQEIFEDMGVIDRLYAAGGPYPITRQHHADGSTTDSPTAELAKPTPAEPYRQPLMVPQLLTEAVLRERLAELGHVVEYSHALTGFTQHAAGVTVHLATPAGVETVQARYLIGADGGRSTVRKALGIDFPGKTLGVRAVVADLLFDGLPRDAWHHFNTHDPASRIMLCPLIGTELFQLQGPIPPEGEIDLSIHGLQAMVRERTGREDLLVRDVPWASAYEMNARLADRYRVDRVFLIGDAAHIHPPTGGQGLNTSAQDAYNLGWKLASVLRGAPDALLDTYEEERRPIAADMLGLATSLLGNAQRGDHRRGREVQQLDLNYRASSLSLQMDDHDTRILPGDRAPDAPLAGAGGQQVRVFDLLRGTHWTLLGYATYRASVAPHRGLHVHGIGDEAEPRAELRDAQGHFATAYAMNPGDWVLIRPDGYVCARANASQLQRLLSHAAPYLR